MANSNNDKNANIPNYDPSKPMDSKQEVAQSPDEKTDQDFPGYPHYPAKEDIMDESTGSHRVDASVENMGTGPNASGVNQRYLAGQEGDRSQSNPIQRQDAENNEALQSNNEEFGVPQNVTNEDLNKNRDLPGTDVEEAAAKGSTNP